MADNPGKPRRPVVGSRTPTGRPRKMPRSVVEPQAPVVGEPVEAPNVEAPNVEAPNVEAPNVEAPNVEVGPSLPLPREKRRGAGVGGRRTTLALVVAVVVLVLIVAAEGAYLDSDRTPSVSASRPVVTGDLTHRAAVEAAARSTEEILSTSYENYDEQVDQAAAKMTDAFAAQYRDTSEGIRDKFVASKTKLQVKAVAQGVVQASPVQVQALLFLDQYVEKTENGQPRTDYRQYRALVTVVHTDQGWLVSNIETQ